MTRIGTSLSNSPALQDEAYARHIGEAVGSFAAALCNRAGVVHGDLDLPNIMVDNDTIGFVDFTLLYRGDPADNFLKLAASAPQVLPSAVEAFSLATGVDVDPAEIMNKASALARFCYRGSAVSARLATIERLAKWPTP